MAKFERPANAIEGWSDLHAGDRVWHVYGIWPPFNGGESIVTREPAPFREHPEWSEIHTNADSIVFDVLHDGHNRPMMEFASDGNLVPGHSYNDNYWFRTEEDALAAVTYLRSQWESQPDEIARSVEQREQLFADSDYYSDYDAA